MSEDQKPEITVKQQSQWHPVDPIIHLPDPSLFLNQQPSNSEHMEEKVSVPSLDGV